MFNVSVVWILFRLHVRQWFSFRVLVFFWFGLDKIRVRPFTWVILSYIPDIKCSMSWVRAFPLLSLHEIKSYRIYLQLSTVEWSSIPCDMVQQWYDGKNKIKINANNKDLSGFCMLVSDSCLVSSISFVTANQIIHFALASQQRN